MRLRISAKKPLNQGDQADALIALNQDTLDRHLQELVAGGVALYNSAKLQPNYEPPLGVQLCPLPVPDLTPAYKELPVMQNQIDRRVRPCVTFNKENTHDWFRKRVYTLEDAGHDPTDFRAAMDAALQWADEIPIGLVYRNPDRRRALTLSILDSSRVRSSAKRRCSAGSGAG